MTRNPSSQSGRERRSRDAESASRYPSSLGTYADSYDDPAVSASYSLVPSSQSSSSPSYRIYDYDSMPSSDRRSDRDRDREPPRKHHRSRVEPSGGSSQPSSHHYSNSAYDHKLVESLKGVTIQEPVERERRSKTKDRDPSRRSKKDAYKAGSVAEPASYNYGYKEDFILYPSAEQSYGDSGRLQVPSDGYYSAAPSYSYGTEHRSSSKPPKAPKIGRIPTPEFSDVPDGMFSCCDGLGSCHTCGGYRYY